jgi:hypothetical protein
MDKSKRNIGGKIKVIIRPAGVAMEDNFGG